eukprot:scaffold1341_cov151-Pinguiococcus_pyrenoidosus.AAC.1
MEKPAFGRVSGPSGKAWPFKGREDSSENWQGLVVRVCFSFATLLTALRSTAVDSDGSLKAP